MHFNRLVITGGAGFVGSSLATLFKTHYEDIEVTVFDNLMRRGSELNLPRLREHGVQFVHGDVRCADDFDALSTCDLLIDCAAEPSALAGASGSPAKLFDINLSGSLNCFECARRNDAAVLFLSTSRVYPIEPLRALPFQEEDSRLTLHETGGAPGISPDGVAETCPTAGARSYYGFTKLAAEQLLVEYAYHHNLPCLIDRCGVLAGPYQMGKVDQGVMTLWAAAHIYGRPLKYIGFGGQGKQVRDLLHVHDLFSLLQRQLEVPERWTADRFNVGGGLDISLSLRELTDLCRALTGQTVDIGSQPETHPDDVPWYISDARKAMQTFDWEPQKSPRDIIEDITRWITDHRDELQPVLGGSS